MQAEIRQLDEEMNDPEAQRDLAERVLRERNGMARKGEIVYRIRGADSDTTARE